MPNRNKNSRKKKMLVLMNRIQSDTKFRNMKKQKHNVFLPVNEVMVGNSKRFEE